MLSKFFCKLLLIFTVISFYLSGGEYELLQTQDVNKIMQQILNQHVDKKEVTTSILKNSFRVYIDQFDPDRIYLLDAEVQPFLNMSDTDANKFLDEYKHNQFSEYMDLNSVIQKAIYRARQIRASLVKDINQLYQQSAAIPSDGYEEWRDPDLRRSFSKDEEQLSNRIKHQFTQFIASERKRYGDSYILNRTAQTIKVFEAESHNHENPYLFLSDHGLPMTEAEKQNAFTMHVLKALANSLDAHTTVLSPAEAFEMRLRLEKEVEGIGIELHGEKNGVFLISKVIENGPAAKSGQIRVKDQLIEIDSTSLKDKSLNEVTEMLRGKNGTTVTLLLKRVADENGQIINKMFSVPLIRDEIAINEDRAKSSFEKYGNGIIGTIKLDSFYQSENGDVTSEIDVREAIQKLDKLGNLRGLILDLRENSGGFLSQSVKVVGLFITNGVVVISKYFNGDEHFYRDMDGKRVYAGPLIVLTSKATASAAEIVAQALQDYGVAIVVGDEHTYGKGSIQSQTVTENQNSAFFKVTVGKYYTVSGKTPQIQGVKADVVVPSQFYHEIIGEEYLDYPLKEDIISDSYNDKLEDVAPNLKPWYMHYYTPSIQHKKVVWKNMLPTLKKNSEYRIAHNKNYQMFLKGASPEEIAAAANGKVNTNFGSDDLQMAEAVNILKDMILLQSQMPSREPIQETADGKQTP